MRLNNLDCIFFGIAWVIIWLSAAAIVWNEDDDRIAWLAGANVLAVGMAMTIGIFGGMK